MTREQSDGDPPPDTLVTIGIEAYARGEYFEAHEHFEQAWLAGGTNRSSELHALAQLAAAMHKHFATRKPEAARAILLRARSKLEGLETSAHRLDLESLRSEVDAWLVDPRVTSPGLRRVTRGSAGS